MKLKQKVSSFSVDKDEPVCKTFGDDLSIDHVCFSLFGKAG